MPQLRSLEAGGLKGSVAGNADSEAGLVLQHCRVKLAAVVSGSTAVLVKAVLAPPSAAAARQPTSSPTRPAPAQTAASAASSAVSSCCS